MNINHDLWLTQPGIAGVLLSRLALDAKRQGLGAQLLRDAITRAVAAAENIGVRALLVAPCTSRPAPSTLTLTSSPHRPTRCSYCC